MYFKQNEQITKAVYLIYITHDAVKAKIWKKATKHSIHVSLIVRITTVVLRSIRKKCIQVYQASNYRNFVIFNNHMNIFAV